MKRGQITIFIILGIIILALVTGLFFIRSYSVEKNIEVEAERVKEVQEMTASIKFFVEGCLKRTAEEGADLLSVQGGYYKPPVVSTVSFDNLVPYYFWEEDVSPDKEDVEKEAANFIEENINNCLQNFSFFINQGLEIKEAEKKAQVTLLPEAVLI